jgi:uncharacterized protein (DUF169 family)
MNSEEEWIMEASFPDFFITRWRKYFPSADLPICSFYTDQVHYEDVQATVHEERCLIGNLARVRDGFPYVYDDGTQGCSGGKRYSGFSNSLRPNFEYFLSCGIPGELEGERYKQSPELVRDFLKNNPPFDAPGRYLVFKRLDRLSADETPQVVIFFATPDVLSGLFALANFDRSDPHGVIAPMGSGCSSIISAPLLEAGAEHPRCVLGMFDVSARPYVPADRLTFAMPMKRFEQMVRNMDESFLVTKSWEAVAGRMGQ